MTVQSSLSTAAPGAQVSLTAIIATTSQAGFPTGNVTFLSGSTTLATMMVGGLIQGGFQYGTALLVTSGLPTGTDSITVQYTGDSNFTGETSPAITVNVVPQPDFSVSASPSPVTVTSPGQSASTTLTIAGVNGFGGVTTFSCAGLPAKSACAFLPATVTGSGTTMLTVTTTAASGVAPGDRNSFNDWTAKSGAIRALVFSAALFILAMQIRRRRWNFAGALFVVALLLSTAACGGGGGTPPPVIPGTPVGTTTVTVTATSARRLQPSADAQHDVHADRELGAGRAQASAERWTKISVGRILTREKKTAYGFEGRPLISRASLPPGIQRMLT